MQGVQQPRVCWVPEYASSSGAEVLEVCELAGLCLDPWQAFTLTNALGERPDHRWAAFEVGVMVSRQNGKGGILEGRELGGLFVLGERLIVHSAHQFDTSLEAFRRLLQLIESAPDLDQMVKRVSRSHGEEGIELKSGQRIRFRTRTSGGGRGFSGDCLILDEAMILRESAHGALLPTLSARPNPQVWYTGSAVDQDVHEHGIVFSRIRERGLKGDDPSLMYVEWSGETSLEDAIAPEVASDPDVWAQANPGLGIRITPDYVANEQRSLDPRTFAVERLGIGDWPSLEGAGGSVIPLDAWDRLVDLSSEPGERIVFAFDTRPDRGSSSIAAAGLRADGLGHVELAARADGVGWVVPWLVERVPKHNAVAVVCDGASPAASLIPKLEENGIEVDRIEAKEHAQACGRFFDAVEESAFRHLGQPEIASAIRGARKRSLGDAWAWSRKSSATDISPLVAATLAFWKAEISLRSVYEDRGLVTV